MKPIERTEVMENLEAISKRLFEEDNIAGAGILMLVCMAIGTSTEGELFETLHYTQWYRKVEGYVWQHLGSDIPTDRGPT
jgi:hypothetical protein